MADNIAYTAGSGTTIATDDVGSVHYQKVKVTVGGDGVVNFEMQSSLSTAIASTSSDAQVGSAGAKTLMGFSFAETASAPGAAKLYIRDGTSSAGAVVAVITLGPSESVREWFGPTGIKISSGVWLDMSSGTVEGSVWTIT